METGPPLPLPPMPRVPPTPEGIEVVVASVEDLLRARNLTRHHARFIERFEALAG
jgi:hypothetical protein